MNKRNLHLALVNYINRPTNSARNSLINALDKYFNSRPLKKVLQNGRTVYVTRPNSNNYYTKQPNRNVYTKNNKYYRWYPNTSEFREINKNSL